MRKVLIVTLIVLSSFVYGQDAKIGVSYTRSYIDRDFDPGKVYFKVTGKKVPADVFKKIIEENPRLYLDKEIDASGNVTKYFYDENNQDRSSKSDYNLKVDEQSEFPNFKLTTIDRQKIELAELKGKLVILRFEMFANDFHFKKSEIAELDKKINELGGKQKIEAIIIFQCSKDEIRQGFDLPESNFKLVADGQNFIEKYGVHSFPSTVLIDQNGKLIKNYNFSDQISLDESLIK